MRRPHKPPARAVCAVALTTRARSVQCSAHFCLAAGSCLDEWSCRWQAAPQSNRMRGACVPAPSRTTAAGTQAHVRSMLAPRCGRQNKGGLDMHWHGYTSQAGLGQCAPGWAIPRWRVALRMLIAVAAMPRWTHPTANRQCGVRGAGRAGASWPSDLPRTLCCLAIVRGSPAGAPSRCVGARAGTQSQRPAAHSSLARSFTPLHKTPCHPPFALHQSILQLRQVRPLSRAKRRAGHCTELKNAVGVMSTSLTTLNRPGRPSFAASSKRIGAAGEHAAPATLAASNRLKVASKSRCRGPLASWGARERRRADARARARAAECPAMLGTQTR